MVDSKYNCMNIAHEAPLSIMSRVREFTDYDYALVHLFEDEGIGLDYFEFFKESLNMGRKIILDNSIFELGKSFDSQKFYNWCLKLKPTEYIIPDSLNNMEETIRKGKEWLENYDLPDMVPIGVVQGNSYEEIVECYKFWVSQNVKVAFSFDYPFLESYDPNNVYYTTKEIRYAMGRIKLISDLVKNRVINPKRKHHLLGCFIPQEFTHYSYYNFIDSVDTSNPVVHGLKGIAYDNGRLTTKVSQPLYTMIREEVDEERLNIIINNICQFRDNIF